MGADAVISSQEGVFGLNTFERSYWKAKTHFDPQQQFDARGVPDLSS